MLQIIMVSLYQYTRTLSSQILFDLGKYRVSLALNYKELFLGHIASNSHHSILRYSLESPGYTLGVV